MPPPPPPDVTIFTVHVLTPYYSKVYFNITWLLFQHFVYSLFLMLEDLIMYMRYLKMV
jgi:hypothetical protein